MFFTKLKWILGISMIFVLIVATNLIDKNNFARVRDSVVNIYEDRLVVKGLLFDMSSLIHEKELAMAVSDEDFFTKDNTQSNLDIEVFIKKYEGTNLTKDEKKNFDFLKENFKSLVQAEKQFIASNYEDKAALQKELSKINQNLYILSEIQLDEGSRQMAISKRALSNVELFTNMEIYLLIFLAVVIQVIVMYKPKKEEIV